MVELRRPLPRGRRRGTGGVDGRLRAVRRGAGVCRAGPAPARAHPPAGADPPAPQRIPRQHLRGRQPTRERADQGPGGRWRRPAPRRRARPHGVGRRRRGRGACEGDWSAKAFDGEVVAGRAPGAGQHRAGPAHRQDGHAGLGPGWHALGGRRPPGHRLAGPGRLGAARRLGPLDVASAGGRHGGPPRRGRRQHPAPRLPRRRVLQPRRTGAAGSRVVAAAGDAPGRGAAAGRPPQRPGRGASRRRPAHRPAHRATDAPAGGAGRGGGRRPGRRGGRAGRPVRGDVAPGGRPGLDHGARPAARAGRCPGSPSRTTGSSPPGPGTSSASTWPPVPCWPREPVPPQTGEVARAGDVVVRAHPAPPAHQPPAVGRRGHGAVGARRPHRRRPRAGGLRATGSSWSRSSDGPSSSARAIASSATPSR